MHYVIGDVHGCFDELCLLIEKIEYQDDAAQFLFVGDWVDRGPKVYETLMWMAEHITPEGKYQSVRGNHDEEAVQWFYHYFLPWKEKTPDYQNQKVPLTFYDFAQVVEDDFKRDEEKLRFVVDAFQKMPFHKLIPVVSAAGEKVLYRIMHAWHPVSVAERYLCSKEKTWYININERNYGGLKENFREIYVHGHTPTILKDYLERGRDDLDRPGLISYRTNVIDVDGGCCFFPYHGYACMLCAICLETLEEFYPYSIEERVKQAVGLYMKDIWDTSIAPLEEIVPKVYEAQLERYYHLEKESPARIRLLKRLGLMPK